MNNLEILQHVCDSVNLPYPADLEVATLTWEHNRILEAIDLAHARLLQERDWPCAHESRWFNTHPVVTGATATVAYVAPNWIVTVESTPFTVGVVGRMTIGDATDRENVAITVTGLTTSTAAVAVGGWLRPAIVTGVPWSYGVCDYTIAIADRVGFLISGNFNPLSISRTLLEESTPEEIEADRSNRSEYIEAYQPLRYGTLPRGGSYAKVRLDPFPNAAQAIQALVYRVPTSLIPVYVEGEATVEATPDIPAEWHEILVDEGIAFYYRTMGMNKNAGAEARFRFSALEADRTMTLQWARQQATDSVAESAGYMPGTDAVWWTDELSRNG